MKVKELIDILKTYDPELPVHFLDNGTVPELRGNPFKIFDLRQSMLDPTLFLYANHKLSKTTFSRTLDKAFKALVWW